MKFHIISYLSLLLICPNEKIMGSQLNPVTSTEPQLQLPQKLIEALIKATKDGATTSQEIAIETLVQLEPDISKLIAILQTKKTSNKAQGVKGQPSHNNQCSFSHYFGTYND